MKQITIQSDFTKDDYSKICLFNIYFKNPIIFILSIVVFILGLITLFPIIPSLFSPIFGILFFIYPLAVLGVTLFQIHKNIKLNKLSDAIYQTITIDDTGICSTKFNQEHNFYWDNIKEVQETKNYLIFYISKTNIVSIPKRNIKSDDIYYIRNIIVNKLSSKNYKLKK